MLLLKRKIGQSIHIGDRIVLKICSVEGGYVVVGVTAPKNVPVMRDELLTRTTPTHPEACRT